jgi:hypothetical protein
VWGFEEDQCAAGDLQEDEFSAREREQKLVAKDQGVTEKVLRAIIIARLK